MHPNFSRVALLASAVLLTSAPALPQSDDTAPRRSPLDAKADVPPLLYRSPFTAYQSITDQKPRSWKEVNDNVERIGGWREYLKEAQQQPDASSQPDPARAPAKTEPAKPTPSERRGHDKH